MIGVVLAGGLSSRLGFDKTRLHLHGLDRPSLLERTVELLRGHTSQVVLSCRCPESSGSGSAQGFANDLAEWMASRGDSLRGVHCVYDEVPGIGPLGGMHACLRAFSEPLMVLSCDLPFMDGDVLRRLAESRNQRPPQAIMTTFQQVETGYIEALVSIYEPACLPYFDAATRNGVRQLNRVVPEALRHHVPYARDEALPFFNVNYPSDLALAKRVIIAS